MPSSKTTIPFSVLLRRTVAAFVLAGAVGFAAYGVYAWLRVEREVQENTAIMSAFLASATQSFFENLANGLEPLGQLLDPMDVLHDPEVVRDHDRGQTTVSIPLGPYSSSLLIPLA